MNGQGGTRQSGPQQARCKQRGRLFAAHTKKESGVKESGGSVGEREESEKEEEEEEEEFKKN